MSDSIFRPYFEEQQQKAASFFAKEHVDDYIADMATNHLNLIHEAFADIDTLIQYEDLVASAESLTNVDLSLIAMSVNNIESKYKNLMNLNVVITESHSDSDRIRITQEALSSGGMALIAGVIAAIIAFIAWIFGKKNDTNTSAGEAAKNNIKDSEEQAKEIQRIVSEAVSKRDEAHSKEFAKEREFNKERLESQRATFDEQQNKLYERIEKLKNEKAEILKREADAVKDNLNLATNKHEKEKEISQKDKEIAALKVRIQSAKETYNKFRKDANNAPSFKDFKTQNSFALAIIPLRVRSGTIDRSSELVEIADIGYEISRCTLDFLKPIVTDSHLVSKAYLSVLTSDNAFSFKSFTKDSDTPNGLSSIPDASNKKGYNISIKGKEGALSFHKNNLVPLQNIIRHEFDLVFGKEFNVEESFFSVAKGPDGIENIMFMPVISFKPTKDSDLKYKEITVERLNIENIIETNSLCKKWIENKNACGFWSFNGSGLSGEIEVLKGTLSTLEAAEKEFIKKGTFGKLNEADSKVNHRILLSLIAAVNKNLHAVVSINDILIRHALGATLFIKQLLGQFKHKETV